MRDGCENEDICKGIREKLLGEFVLDADEKAHLESCDRCRKFNEDLSKMLTHLSKLNVESLAKNGVSLTDSVMDEVGKRRLFASAKASKVSWGRHIGLVAACLVIAVMAIPAVKNGLTGEKNNLAVYEASDEAAPEAETDRNYETDTAAADLEYSVEEEAKDDGTVYRKSTGTLMMNSLSDFYYSKNLSQEEMTESTNTEVKLFQAPMSSTASLPYAEAMQDATLLEFDTTATESALYGESSEKEKRNVSDEEKQEMMNEAADVIKEIIGDHIKADSSTFHVSDDGSVLITFTFNEIGKKITVMFDYDQSSGIWAIRKNDDGSVSVSEDVI